MSVKVDLFDQGDVPNGLVSSNLNTTSTTGRKAFLMLIPPKILPNTKIHPFALNLNHEVINYVGSVFNQNPNLLLSSSLHKDMLGKNIVTPTIDSIDVDFTNIRDKWTFVLIIDMGIVSKESFPTHMKTIASGFCTLEPINPKTLHLTTPTFNPSTQLCPTRYLELSTIETGIGAKGLTTMEKLTVEQDIVHRLQAFINMPVLKNTINSFGSHLVMNTDGMFSPLDWPPSDHQQINSSNDVTVIGDDEDLRTAPVIQILPEEVKPINMVQELLNNSHTVAEQFTDPVSNSMDGTDPLIVSSCLKEEFSIPSYNMLTIRDNTSTTNILMLQDILQTLDPDVSILKPSLGDSFGTEVIDSTTITPSILYNRVLSQILPPYATQHEISEIIFSFSSYNGYFNIHHVDFLVQITPDIQQAKINGFHRDLLTEVLPFLKGAGGDFDMNVVLTPLGITNIEFNFLDYARLNGSTITSGVYKGVNSQAYSDISTFHNNVRAIDAFSDNFSFKLTD